MAQMLEEFEERMEVPLGNLHASLPAGPAAHSISGILLNAEGVKRTFRRKLDAFAADCADLMPSDVEINAFEPIIRR
jgi:hypothetical protein